jgi:hypothetical protein
MLLLSIFDACIVHRLGLRSLGVRSHAVSISVLHLARVVASHRVDTFRCGVHGCTHALASLAAFESHYAAHHRHACRTCGACFASGRWLELHLAERHDSMFRLLAERRKMVR